VHHHLVELIILLISAIAAVSLFRLFNIGAILAYLFAGIVIGPGGLGLIGDPDTILKFSELGVVFLLFLIGLELQPARLWRMKRHVFGMGLLQVVLCGFCIMAFPLVLGFSKEMAFVAGFGLALSSTAFSLQILGEKKQLATTHGQGSFAILLFQDLAIVPLIAMIPVLAGSESSGGWLSGLKAFGFVVGLVVAGLYFVRYFFSFIARSRVQEVFTATSLFVVIGAAVLAEAAGLSMGMGAFLAGVVLANSEYRHELEINLQPFKGLLLGLFFMAVGMSLDLNVVFSQPHVIAFVVFSFMAIKVGVVFGLARFFKFPFESARNMSFTLLQGGEFAFVLFSAALAVGVLSPEQAAILNASVTISMALTPFIFNLNQRYMRTFSEISERPYDNISSEGARVIVAGYGRFGQIVSRFLKSQGVSYTILEHSAGQVDTARKYGRKIFYGDASRADIVESAGGATAKIFVLAIDDVETSKKTATMVRKHFPHLEIVARVRNRQHAIDLMALGVHNVHRETYLTSLEVAKEVMLSLGGVREDINKKLALFRRHDEDILKRQYEMRDDESGMISMTARANAELETILSQEALKE
jgi:monovalent cation:proton antiporter-2 (CPA2) family protein